MLICDSIMQNRNVEDMRLLLTDVAFSRLQRDVGLAQKFVLDKSIASAADAVQWQEVEKVMHQCRLPFGQVWMECLHRERPQFWAADMMVNYRKDIQIAVRRPKRVAVLMRGIEHSPHDFVMSLFWSFESDIVQTAALDMVFNLGENSQMTMGLRRAMNLPQKMIDGKDLPELEKRLSPVPSPYFTEFFLGIDDHPAQQEVMRELFQAASGDWGHEQVYWTAVLALLNCRNVAETRTVDLTGLNHARKKRGMPLFTEHKILLLRLPAAARAAGAGNPDAARAAMRGHFVRGHFKVRKTGIFWWSDFARGNMARMLHKTYKPTLKENA